jgi:hypothetical protein
MNPETALQQRILADVGASVTHRLWRNARGKYFAGSPITRGPGIVTLQASDLVLRGGTQVSAGLCDGASDLVGIVSVPVRLLDPDGIAGIFAGIEIKTPKGETGKHQLAWIEVIRSLGGIAGRARSVDEARALIAGGGL